MMSESLNNIDCEQQIQYMTDSGSEEDEKSREGEGKDGAEENNMKRNKTFSDMRYRRAYGMIEA